jgi:hypothetical protein
VKQRKWHGENSRPFTIAVCIVAGLCVSTAFAQSTSVVARAAAVTGQAVLRAPGLAPLALTPGYILNPGDRIDTRGGGRVVVDLSDGSMVVISPESVVTLKDYRAANTLRELFEITLGMVRVKINHYAGKPNPYRMNSPTASIAVRGTEFSIAVDSTGGTEVVVYEGAVEVASLTDPNRRVLIEAGRGVLVQGGQDFHLIAAVAPAQGGDRDAADRNGGQADRNKGPVQQGPVQQANAPPPQQGSGPQPQPQPSGYGPPQTSGGGTQPVGPQQASAPPPNSGNPAFNNGSSGSHNESNESPRATAGTYDSYLASLADIGQLPFLLRFNAFPEAHLDSLENPAYATQFTSAEGRLFVLPTLRGAQTLREYQSAFGPGGNQPSTYSISPQVSYFAPYRGFNFGGSFSASHVGNSSLTSTSDYDPGTLDHGIPSTTLTKGSSSTTYYTAALVGSRRFGANSFGLELALLNGTGSSSSQTSQPEGPGHLASEVLDSTTAIHQTRITAGYSRDLSRDTRFGVYYRYARIGDVDQDVNHTINGFAAGLNSTHTGGHSSEFGMRLRGVLTPRLYYGIAAGWLGVSLLDGMVRTTTVDSHERDRAQRGSAAVGLGYALTRNTTLTFDLAGGNARNAAARTEDSSFALLQNASANSRFVSTHVAVQVDATRKLFLTASFLNIWQNHNLNVDLFPDQFGNRTLVEDSFFPMSSAASVYAPRFSDFGVGWRFTRDLFVQYVFSTDYGYTAGTHTLMLRYTFKPRE